MTVFAKKGDQVTCENGHPICIVAGALKKGFPITASDFKNWKIKIDLSSGAEIPFCPHCGGLFIGKPRENEGFKIFIDGQWRP